jgi:Haem-NO-binding
MLGMVFTEFVELVEERFSPALADAVLQDVAPPHGGAYTAVGYYPHEEMLALVGALSARTGVAAPELVKAFGHHLLTRFTQGHGEMFARSTNLFDFVASIDGHIHVEVHKLYDKATLPRFTVLSRTPTTMTLLYQSSRHMEMLAQGLLEGAAQHYGEDCRITHAPFSCGLDEGVLFTLDKTQR